MIEKFRSLSFWFTSHSSHEDPHSPHRIFKTLVFHIRPRMVAERTLRFTLTFGLGGMAVVLVTLQIFTGILLKFAYEPFPVQAYDSLIRLQTGFPFGQFIRNIHFWSANFLVGVLFLHGLRVFFTGAFRTPRRVNWIVGLSLFLLVLAANLTGYLLPWDQLAYWATTICLGMLDYIPGIGNRLQQWVMGGPQLGPAALRNFFALHTAVLPVIIVALMTYHFWKIRKAGGLVVPKSPEEIPEEKPAMVPSNPNLLLREAAVALSAIACVLTVELNPEPLRPEKFGEKGFLRMRFPSKQGMLARVACACLLAACICILHAHDGQTAEVKKVLILFPEEGWSAPAYRTAYNAIKSAFDEADQTQITLLGESLDLYLFPSEDRERALADFLREKYARERIYLIIPVANSSINFMLRYRDSIFPGIPMVYCGGVTHGNKRLEPRSDVTGTTVTLDIAGTIELARVLQPDLKRIAVVAGTGLVDRYMLSFFHEVFEVYEGKLELLDLAGLPLDNLLERVSRLPASTVILYLALQRDGAGRIFSSSAIQKLVSQTANVPLFNFIDTTLGYGSVGGRMTQIYTMSRKTAEIALRVLSGESIASIEPAVISDNPAMFDWRELKRWGIGESALPPGSIVRFKEVSPWGFNRWWIIGAFSFICLQTLLIFLLVNNLIKRKRAEEQTSRLRQQVAHMSRVSTVGQLGQNLAHEINQPLAAIRVNAEVAQKLLADEHPDLAEVRGALGDIVSDNQRAQDVVQRIRNLVKNTQPLHTRVDFNRIVADTLLVIQADAESKGVTIQQDLEKDLPPVHGDPVQLQQVILNLIINATEAVIQAQSPLRIVIVKTGRQGEKGVSLSVSDTGTGVDLKTEKRLFEPFFTTKPQGLGLGLSISRSIVEAHDGSLSFSSNLDRGATFCIRLPVASNINAKHSTGGPIDAE